jgi:hypothetical protein
MNDLKRLSSLGDLPISLEQNSTIRVRFPGCDSVTVERLCDEVGVQRGIVYEDPDFLTSVGGEVALLFPFASTSEHTVSSPNVSARSETGHRLDESSLGENPWIEDFESMDDGSTSFAKPSIGQLHSSSDYEGLEGIYKFLEVCNQAQRF